MGRRGAKGEFGKECEEFISCRTALRTKEETRSSWRRTSISCSPAGLLTPLSSQHLPTQEEQEEEREVHDG